MSSGVRQHTPHNRYFRILNDGFIALKGHMGDDSAIEQAARVSYGKGTRSKRDTERLLKYLMNNRHTSPFEQVEMKFHVRVPMDCWRQWIRHRTANVNEYSTRYSEAINSMYSVEPMNWRLQATHNKQGSYGFLPKEQGEYLSQREQELHKLSREVYEERLSMGVARELARKDLPLSTYTEAFWKCDLHNILHFLGLRIDSHAQWEIQQYAYAMACVAKELFPISFEAWQLMYFPNMVFTMENLFEYDISDRIA